MKHSVDIDPEKGRVVVAYRGPVLAAHGPVLFERMVRDPCWRPDFDRLVLYDEGRFSGFSVEEMTQFVADAHTLRDRYFGGRPPRTAHVCLDPVKQVHVRYWLAAISRDAAEPARLFQDRAPAEAWLDVEAGAGTASGDA